MSKIKNDLTVAYQIPGNNRKMDSPAVIVISQKMAEDGMAKRRRSFLAFWAIFVCFYGLSFLIGYVIKQL